MLRRKLIVCLAVFFCLLPLAALGEGEEIYVLDTNGSAILADSLGSVRIVAGKYAAIVALKRDELFAARPVGESGWGLITSDGTALTDFSYESLEYENELIFFQKGGLFGVASLSGEVLIKPLYTRLICNGEGGYLALKSDPLDDTPDMVYFVDAQGAEQSSGVRVAYSLPVMSEGLTEAVTTTGLYGYLGAQGDWAIEPAYLWCGAFHFARALAATETGMGVIDKSGDWLIEPIYKRVILSQGNGDAPALALDGEAVTLIDARSGKAIASFRGNDTDAAFCGGGIRLAQDGKQLLIDYTGKVLFEAPEGTLSLNERGGYIITRRAFSEKKPYSFVSPGGAEHGDWQELSFAGVFDGQMYFLYSYYDTQQTTYPDYGLTFFDEVIGTRRYGLLDGEGHVLADGFISLKKTGSAVLTAESDDWIGLIRPDGTEIMRLDKEE